MTPTKEENSFITDLAWSTCGSRLVYSSSDGIGSVTFEWGKVLPGAWSMEKLVEWRLQRHLQVAQPWDTRKQLGPIRTQASERPRAGDLQSSYDKFLGPGIVASCGD